MGLMRHYTSAEACVLSGATYRQLDYWARSGYINPTWVVRHQQHDDDLIREVRSDRDSGLPPISTQRRLNISKTTYYGIVNEKDVPVGRDPAVPGSGYGRGWLAEEIHVIARMVRLVNAGITPERAAEAARSEGEHELAPGVFVRVEVPEPA